MKRDTERLSPAHVRNAKLGMHCDGGGLYLQAKPAANGTVNKSWLFRYATGEVTTSTTGKPRNVERQMGLGSVDAVGLGEARRLAAEFRLLRKAGHRSPRNTERR
jgi:hypothetical protein